MLAYLRFLQRKKSLKKVDKSDALERAFFLLKILVFTGISPLKQPNCEKNDRNIMKRFLALEVVYF